MKKALLIAAALAAGQVVALASAPIIAAIDPGQILTPTFYADGVEVWYEAADGFLSALGPVVNVRLEDGSVIDLTPYDAEIAFWASLVGVEESGGLTTALFDDGGLLITAYLPQDAGAGVDNAVPVTLLEVSIGDSSGGVEGLSIGAVTGARQGVLAAVGVPTGGELFDAFNGSGLRYAGMLSILFNVRDESGRLLRITSDIFGADFIGEADCNVGPTTRLIPEPSSVAMLCVGLAGLLAGVRRRG